MNCAGDATYTATYAPTYINYTIVFKDYDGSIIKSATYHYGDTITVPNEPTRNADNTYTYAFSGWSFSVSSTCNGNVTYTATYSSAYIDYIVIFKNHDGSILSSNTYHYGDTVTIPSAPQKPNDGDISYTFVGWDKEVSTTCNANATYIATFKVAEQEMLGDTNSDDTLNSDDAIYLLKHSLFPDMYPINQTSDFDGNGETNSDDAIYLLKHTLFPDMYPLHDATMVVLALPPQNVKYKDDSDDGDV